SFTVYLIIFVKSHHLVWFCPRKFIIGIYQIVSEKIYQCDLQPFQNFSVVFCPWLNDKIRSKIIPAMNLLGKSQRHKQQEKCKYKSIHICFFCHGLHRFSRNKKEI